jgi:cyanophycinase-like exopeptidase
MNVTNNIARKFTKTHFKVTLLQSVVVDIYTDIRRRMRRIRLR